MLSIIFFVSANFKVLIRQLYIKVHNKWNEFSFNKITFEEFFDNKLIKKSLPKDKFNLFNKSVFSFCSKFIYSDLNILIK